MKMVQSRRSFCAGVLGITCIPAAAEPIEVSGIVSGDDWAHYMKASRQILDNAPMLQSEINNRLLYGLALEEEGLL